MIWHNFPPCLSFLKDLESLEIVCCNWSTFSVSCQILICGRLSDCKKAYPNLYAPIKGKWACPFFNFIHIYICQLFILHIIICFYIFVFFSLRFRKPWKCWTCTVTSSERSTTNSWWVSFLFIEQEFIVLTLLVTLPTEGWSLTLLVPDYWMTTSFFRKFLQRKYWIRRCWVVFLDAWQLL